MQFWVLAGLTLVDARCASHCYKNKCTELNGSPYFECKDCDGKARCQNGEVGFGKGESCDVVTAQEDPCCERGAASEQATCQGVSAADATRFLWIVGGLASIAAWIYCRRSQQRRQNLGVPAANQQLPGAYGYPAPGTAPMPSVQAVAMPMPASETVQEMQILSVPCPLDAGPGSMIMVQGPSGPMQVQVPPGVMPGQPFQFQAPAAPRVAQAVAVAQPVTSAPGQVVMGMPL